MSGSSEDHDADLCERVEKAMRDCNTTATGVRRRGAPVNAACARCGRRAPAAKMHEYWNSYYCTTARDCARPVGPKQRKPMTSDELDGWEQVANSGWNAVIEPDEFRWLIDCARKVLANG